jgi:hypothetical protein
MLGRSTPAGCAGCCVPGRCRRYPVGGSGPDRAGSGRIELAAPGRGHQFGPVVLPYRRPWHRQRSDDQKFEEAGLSPHYRDVTEDPEALALLKGMGYSSTPVVIVAQNGDEIFRWSGLDPVKIDGAISVEQKGTR